MTILSFVSFLGASGAMAQSASKPSVQPPADAPISPTTTTATENSTIENLKNQIRKDPKNLSLIVNLAQAFYDKEEYKKTTLLLWKQITRLDQEGLILLAKAHEKRKEPGEMIRALNNAIGKNAKDFAAHTLMGHAYMLQKKPKEALESYKVALELNPKYEPAYLGVADLYESRTPPNLYELRIIYQDMISNLGPHSTYLSKICEINALDEGTAEAAITTCKEAIQKDSSVADNHVYLGLSQKAIGDLDGAVKTLKKAAATFPKSELAQYHYGKELEEKKNYLDAMKIYKTGTDAAPQSARSWLGLAKMSFEIHLYEVALEAYRRACKFDHKNAVAFRRATTTLRNNRNSEWAGKFESAAETCTFN